VTRGLVAAAAAAAMAGCAREAAPPVVDVDAALEQAVGALAGRTPEGRARADSLYRAVLAADPDQSEARYGVAGLALESGDPWGAQWHLVRLLRAHPDHAGARSLLGLVAYSQGRLDDAIPHLEHLGRLRALTFEESVALADTWNKRNQFARAESAFAAVRERFPAAGGPNAARVLEGLGYARWKQGRLEEAAADFAAALARGGAPPSTRLFLADVLADLDRPDEAAAALPELSFEEARAAGILADYFVLRNRLRLRSGSDAEIAEGVKELESVAAEVRDQVKVPHLLALLRRRLGDLEGARAAAELHAATIRAVDRRDDERAERDLLDGAAAEGSGDAEAALAAYRRGLQTAPDNESLLCAQATVLAALGRDRESRDAFARLGDLPGGEPVARRLVLAGSKLRRQGLFRAAARRFEEAGSRLPGEAEPVFLRALALSEAGDWDAALRVGAPLERRAGSPAP
jgi:tetratricopeptide (TPR) repeat protein